MNIQRLKDMREEQELNQKDIAKILKVSQQQYAKYEMGINNIPIEKLNILANFYNTSIDYLLSRTDEINAYSKPKEKVR